jgi:hypothetical protein
MGGDQAASVLTQVAKGSDQVTDLISLNVSIIDNFLSLQKVDT